MKHIDNDKADIVFKGKSVHHVIGEIIEVEFTEGVTFNRHETGEYLDINDERVKDARIKSNIIYSEYQGILSRRRAKKERSSIENMTIKELKEWCKKSYSRRASVREYLRSLF